MLIIISRLLLIFPEISGKISENMRINVRYNTLSNGRSSSSQRRSHHDNMRHEYFERRCRRTKRRRRRQTSLHQTSTVGDSTTSDSEMMSSGRNWRLSPSPVFHLLHHHHQATYCVNSLKDNERLQVNSPASLVVDSSADTDSQSHCQVRNTPPGWAKKASPY